jgi:hypothetical protein
MECSYCRQVLLSGVGHGPGHCLPAPPPRDAAEDAFWDAAVIAFAQPLIGHGALFTTIIHESCDVADALVAERRKRRGGKS